MLSSIVQTQTKGRSDDDIEELILDEWHGTELTREDKALLERFTELEFLSMNNCGLNSLKNFPSLPQLLRLELNDNKLSSGFDNLPDFPNLMQICLAGNLVKNLADLDPLVSATKAKLPGLIALDLFRCPVAEKPEYRQEMFNKLKALSVLDNLNRAGEEESISDVGDEDVVEEDEDLGSEEEEGSEDEERIPGIKMGRRGSSESESEESDHVPGPTKRQK